MVMALYRLIAFAVVAAIATAGIALAMVAWLVVIAYGAISPRSTVRSACDSFLANIHDAVAQVKALRPS